MDKFDLKKSHVFGSSITKVMKSKNKVEIWGSGNAKREVMYVEDLSNAILFLMENIFQRKKKFYNFVKKNHFLNSFVFSIYNI